MSGKSQSNIRMFKFQTGCQVSAVLLLFYASALATQLVPPIDRQLLDCGPQSEKLRGRTKQPCSLQPSIVDAIANSSQSSPASSQNHGEEGKKATSESKIFSINFNNVLHRKRSNFDGEVLRNCTSPDQNDGYSADVVCLPKVSRGTKMSSEQRRKQIEVRIIDSDESRGNATNTTVRDIVLGTTNIVQCRFEVVDQNSSAANLDLKFRLRWLRSVVGSQGYQNHSINTDDEQSIAVSAESKRMWTVQRKGGLDLFISNFKIMDVGDYFCQAIPLTADSSEPSILDEQRIHLVVRSVHAPQDRSSDLVSAIHADTSLYSQENLQKLLPSLYVTPEYSEVALGGSVQLVCVTRDLDPDPDPSKIVWTYEPFERPGFRSLGARSSIDLGPTSLPPNSSKLDNVLIIWSMSLEAVGIYKCTIELEDFNLTAQAAGELMLRPSVDSAPLVYMTPELLRMSANGSATLQCESTGYPPPRLEWYRVDVPVSQAIELAAKNHTNVLADQSDKKASFDQLEGVELNNLGSRDAMAYCEQAGCLAVNNHRLQGGETYEVLVTAISLVNFKQARPHHQGQYVCIATNKHGQNQASALVDVEFREAPRVRIADEFREQTIVLDKVAFGTTPSVMQNVTFKCSIEAGQPTPRLRWLRSSSNVASKLAKKSHGDYDQSNRLIRPGDASETFDLSRVSSATSKVATRYEANGRTLVLQLSTISIDDEGEYVCLGENELGRHSDVARLLVQEPAQVRILQTSPRLFKPNDSFQLDCLVSGHPAPLDIEWSRSDRGAFFALISHQASSSGTGGSGGGNGLHVSSGGPSMLPPLQQASQERAVLKFDRVTGDDAGEYTCAARDPLNSSVVLRDTIMLMLADEIDKPSKSISQIDEFGQHQKTGGSGLLQRQLPKLLIRPTKVLADLGSNITLDCLAISGLQPTIVEWLAPSAHMPPMKAPNISIKSYYRSYTPTNHYQSADVSRSLLQFGSKLRILNVGRAHEGVYQCKGSNKAGVENAPALVKVIEPLARGQTAGAASAPEIVTNRAHERTNEPQLQTKTKVAKVGSNIELRCQVNGMVEQPATSWSRVGHELPASSVQIEHNLWLRNLTKADEGLYLCSARSNEPQRVIQARINLLVSGSPSASMMPWTGYESGDEMQRTHASPRYDPASLTAKIVASKGQPNLADSITLECIISFVGRNFSTSDTTIGNAMNTTPADDSFDWWSANERWLKSPSVELEELERQVVWTNLHSGQSLFQNNVYIQNNLLIIYDLKQENAATYRCHFNDLLQHTDYKLQLAGTNSVADDINDIGLNSSQIVDGGGGKDLDEVKALIGLSGQKIKLVSLPVGSRLSLACESAQGKYFWTRGNGAHLASARKRRRIGQESRPLVIEAIESSDADLYQCNQKEVNETQESKIVEYHLIQVQLVAAKFVQQPVSFISLPAVKDADHQLELEMKFFPEHEHGLLLFSDGGQAMLSNSAQHQQPSRSTGALNQADYITLGLTRSGHLEFKFELGDGTTALRSLQPVELHQWHRVIVERNRRGATMWLDGQAPVSSSLPGKFFNLNLDSLLYVGGHQIFLTLNSSDNSGAKQMRKRMNALNGTRVSEQTGQQALTRDFYGYTQGFQGCVSSLRINRRELNLMVLNRAVTMGIFECDKLECVRQAANSSSVCTKLHGSCQVDRSDQNRLDILITDKQSAKRRQSLASADLRCICLPPYFGPSCSEIMNTTQARVFLELADSHRLAAAPTKETPAKIPIESHRSTQDNCDQLFAALSVSQQIVKRCNSTGTGQCQALSTSSFRCHCKLGFGGEQCDQPVSFASSETAVWFNQQAYVQFAFNTSGEVLQSVQLSSGQANSIFNQTENDHLISFTDKLNLSLRIQTRSSYGLLFYTGRAGSFEESPSATDTSLNPVHRQISKSAAANLLARLSFSGSSMALSRTPSDFLALSLVDGHVELSYELGSGIAVIRATRRLNDGLWHKLDVTRTGKTASMVLDEIHKYEGQSPGRLFALNTPADIYLGGLPSLIQLSGVSAGKMTAPLAASASSIQLMSSFSGCLAGIQINSLGPINLVRNDHLTKLKEVRNILPCKDQEQLPPISADNQRASHSSTSMPKTTTKPSRRPSKPTHSPEIDGDDSDELAA